ncbi:MAG: hypothetical protein A2Y76_10255 [Planctomycetes bacterium RBG_13_60_9]|nr:MAG: hypothetical protein A2Y76_10255 [Planctomycetes bacterium RBG_13_60_9]
MKEAFRQHLHSSDDLQTTYEAIRAGFIALALEKNRRATPFVEQARALKEAAARAKTPAALLNMTDIQAALLTAAGDSPDLGCKHCLPKRTKEDARIARK